MASRWLTYLLAALFLASGLLGPTLLQSQASAAIAMVSSDMGPCEKNPAPRESKKPPCTDECTIGATCAGQLTPALAPAGTDGAVLLCSSGVSILLLEEVLSGASIPPPKRPPRHSA